MAVFAASDSNDFKAKISSANETVLIWGCENHLHYNLEKNMDYIRSTIMQQEALFRQQVQALHKLYDVQKSAMQEIKKNIYSQAQKWVHNSESVTIGDNSLCSSVLVVKPLRPAFANAESFKEESLALSLHPFCALEEVKSCDSLCKDSHGANTSCSSRRKPMIHFDLEKLPEDNADESENQGSLVSTSQNFSPVEVENPLQERISEQARRSITSGPTLLHQYVEQNGLIKTTQPKLEGQPNDYVGVKLLAKDPVICSKGSLTLGTLQPGPINLDDFLIEMAVSSETNSVSQKQHSHLYGFTSKISASGKNENLDNSSNSIVFQYLKSYKVKKNISI